MMYLIRCKYVAMYDELAGVGYLDAHSRCTSELRNAKTFKSEAGGVGFCHRQRLHGSG